MKTSIDVSNRKEGELIKRALEDRQVRAFVNVMGALMELPTIRARARVLRYFEDRLTEDEDDPAVGPI
jgi:hypothetical protein